MAKTKRKVFKKKTLVKIRSRSQELDSFYALKIIIYLIIGTLWIRLVNPSGTVQIPLPVGLIVGIFFVMRDHFKIDRKIEYAVLLVAMFVGFWSQVGVFITY
ncbi:MAG: hypothetical protein ACREF5_00650 [Candidatus Saccharimonadales bacterium]